jgi:hypothetical protein
MKGILSTLIILISVSTYAQNVGIGTTSPAAKLDITSANSGILIPRLALTGTNDATTVPSPVTSTMIYNTATVTGGNAVTPGFYYWNGSVWVRVIDNNSVPNIYTADGSLTGNRTVTMGADNLIFNTSGAGKMGIGYASPGAPLEIRTSVAYNTPGYDPILKLGGNSSNATAATVYRNYANAQHYVGIESVDPASTAKRPLVFQEYGGNVGLGTNNPLQTLEVGSNGGVGFSGSSPNLNSSDKKIYSPADGDLEWMTNSAAVGHGFAVSHQGTKYVYLNIAGNSYLNGGNVGIGTTGPTDPLFIVNSSNARITVQGSGTNYAGYLSQNGSANYFAGINNASTRYAIYDNTNGAERISLLQSGLVGINTSTPGNTLTVNGSGGMWNNNQFNFYSDGGTTQKGFVGEYGASSDFSLAATTNGNWMRIGSNNANIAFFPDNTITSGTNLPKVVISAAGSVGIGTINPGATLDVEGTTKMGAAGTVLKSMQMGQVTVGAQGQDYAYTLTFPNAFANIPKGRPIRITSLS